MIERRGKNGSSGKDGPDEDEAQLWEEYARDIAPIKKKSVKQTTPSLKKPPAKKPRAENSAPVTKSAVSQVQQPPQLDARLDQRLRRGQVPLEGTLDLHGMTQEQAHTKLKSYITGAHSRGKRCLLIITGKGRGSGEGVLRQKFPLWIGMEPLKNIVLKIVPAAPSHGGTGAWYVYLKRERNY